MTTLFVAFIASLGIVAIKFLIPHVLHILGLKHDPPLVKSMLIFGLQGLFILVTLSMFLTIAKYLPSDNFILLVVFALFFPFFTSFEFMVRPLLLRFQSNLKEEKGLSGWLSETHQIPVKVFSCEGELVNAYATGAVPFANTIILGKLLTDRLDDASLKAILLHEAGHLKLNHLFYLYLGNIVSCALFGFLLGFLFNLSITPEFLKIGVIVFSAAVCSALLFELVPGFFRKHFEFQADSYSSQRVGPEVYAKALTQLDQISEGRVSRGGYSHPALKERIKNIETASAGK